MPSARIQEMFSEGVGRNREPSQRQLSLRHSFLSMLPGSRRGVTVKTLYEEYRGPILTDTDMPVSATISCVTVW